MKNGEDTTEGKDNLWDSDSDEDGVGAGMSPPKTIFVDVPQGRLVRTPGERSYYDHAWNKGLYIHTNDVHST